MNSKLKAHLQSQESRQTKKEHEVWGRLKVSQKNPLDLPLVKKIDKAIKEEMGTSCGGWGFLCLCH